MPRRNRDNLRKFLPNTPNASNSQPSLFSGGCKLEEPLGEKPDIFEDPTREEEEEEEPIPTKPMAEIEMTEEINKELRVPSPSGRPMGILR